MRLIGLWALLFSVSVQAEVIEKTVAFEHEDESFEAVMMWDDSIQGQRPGVMVVHQWWGRGDYEMRRGRQLAEMGYVSLVMDMYGKGMLTDKPAQAQAWMEAVTADTEDWQARLQRGIAELRKSELVKQDDVAAIGYCFGGASVLQLAYSGADVDAVVSFHGALPAAPDEAKGQIGAQILVLHGQDDPFVSREVARHFQDKLDDADADWEMVSYSGVKHSFTDPGADKRGIAALKYDARADERSWKRMHDLFEELW